MNVSVIIPVYNGVKYVGEAIESIYGQTSEINEIICIDDASDDSTFNHIAKNFPNVRLFRNEVNQGPSYSRNVGINRSQSEYVSFLDADDLWVEDKTKWQLEAFKKDPGLKIVGGMVEIFSLDTSDVPHPNTSKSHFNTYLSSFLIKKSVFNQLGDFDVGLRLSEDQDWFLRVREAEVPFKIIHQTVLRVRRHQSNTTKGLNFKQSGFISALKKSLDRRRFSGDSSNLGKIK